MLFVEIYPPRAQNGILNSIETAPRALSTRTSRLHHSERVASLQTRSHLSTSSVYPTSEAGTMLGGSRLALSLGRVAGWRCQQPMVSNRLEGGMSSVHVACERATGRRTAGEGRGA